MGRWCVNPKGMRSTGTIKKKRGHGAWLNHHPPQHPNLFCWSVGQNWCSGATARPQAKIILGQSICKTHGAQCVARLSGLLLAAKAPMPMPGASVSQCAISPEYQCIHFNFRPFDFVFLKSHDCFNFFFHQNHFLDHIHPPQNPNFIWIWQNCQISFAQLLKHPQAWLINCCSHWWCS